MSAFDIINIILVVVSGVCTFVSLKSALKANSYYNKSKNLLTYKDVSIAYKECQTIIDTFSELYYLANKKETLGKNVDKLVAGYGKSMKKSLNEIRAKTYEKDFKEVKEYLETNESEIEGYIDALISGDYVENNLFIKNKDAKTCEKNIKRVQELIKDRVDTVSESLK